MEIKGTLQPEELLAAQWLHMRPRPLSAVSGLVIAALCVGALWFFFFGSSASSDSPVGWVLLLCVLYLLFFFLVYIPYKTRRSYRQRKDLQRQCAFTVSADGLEGQTENGFVKRPWSDFLGWKEGKTLFLLYISDAMYLIIPKRFFPSADAVDSFRQMLQSKISRK